MKPHRQAAYALILFTYFVEGAMVLTINTTLKSLLADYQWTDGQGGLLIACMSAGMLVASLVGNTVMERLGRSRTLLLLSVMLLLSVGLFSLSPWAETFFPLLFVTGLVWGGINSLANTVVNELYDGNASRLNVMHACFAVGAVTFPLLVGLCSLRRASWRIVPGIVAALGAVLLVLSLRVPLPEGTAPEARKASAGAFWREPRYYCMLAALFIYVGCESSASAWLSSFLSRRNAFFQAVPSETMVSLMWLLMIVGRLIFAALGARIPKGALLVGESAAFLLGMLGMVLLVENTPAAIASVAFMGLGMSAIYGTVIASSARFVSGSALSAELIFSAGGLGSTLIPALAGGISDRSGLQVGMLSLCGFLAVLVAVSVVNLMLEKKEEAS